MTRSSTPASSPYTQRSPEPARLGWSRLLARVFLVSLPSHVVGTVLAAVLILLVGAREHPAVGWASFLLPGLVAGLALGLLLRTDRADVPRRALVVAAVSVFVTLALVLVARARVTTGDQPGLASMLFPGLLVTVVLETGLAVALWWWQGARR